MEKQAYYLISETAKKVKVESHVLRYWEEELEIPIKRNELGHRYYTEEDVQRFREIKNLKEQGLQLKAIRMILKDGKLERLRGDDSLESFIECQEKTRDAEKSDTGKTSGAGTAGVKADGKLMADKKAVGAGGQAGGNGKASGAGGQAGENGKTSGAGGQARANGKAAGAGGQTRADGKAAGAGGQTRADGKAAGAGGQARADEKDAEKGENTLKAAAAGNGAPLRAKAKAAAEGHKDAGGTEGHLASQNARMEGYAQSGQARHMIEVIGKKELSGVREESREEKSMRLQILLQHMIAEAVRSNNRELCDDIKETVLKEMDYQFRLQEEREDERESERIRKEDEHYRQLDELLRSYSKRGRTTRRSERKERKEADTVKISRQEMESAGIEDGRTGNSRTGNSGTENGEAQKDGTQNRGTGNNGTENSGTQNNQMTDSAIENFEMQNAIPGKGKKEKKRRFRLSRSRKQAAT